jgi:23S rRNA (cytosine1962-C5)-methyltransferase
VDLAPFANRLAKNQRHWGKWAKRREISCYRIYDRDIPEFPLAIDWYEGQVHAQLFAGPKVAALDPQQEATLAEMLCAVLSIEPQNLACKTRQRQRGLSQYLKTGRPARPFLVQEAGLTFEVDLHTYLDTGLFLDHRNTRQLVRDLATGKRILNLFAYTGSFSVYAIAGGARSTTSVDLSNTYLEWFQRNLRLNGLDTGRNVCVRADVLSYLVQARQAHERFELIILDPPSFSNSKKMRQNLDVQRDHPGLIQACLDLLESGGELLFSTNRRKFRLEPSLAESLAGEEITRHTVPEDFRRHFAHRCWRFRKS